MQKLSNEFKRSCYDFNTIAGKDKKVTRQDFLDQQGILESEVKELRDGIEANDLKETLDGVIDVLVVAYGHLQKLKNLGVNVEEALKRIADNNLSKFIKEIDKEKIADEAEVAIRSKGTPGEVYLTKNEQYGVWVIKRRSDDKVMKPLSFVNVDLSDLLVRSEIE